MKLVIEVYKLTENYPKTELFSLTSQTRRSALSIPSNIAEGRSRGGMKEYKQFLNIAFGSGAELETQLEIAKNLPLGSGLNFSIAESLLSEVMKMLNKMISIS